MELTKEEETLHAAELYGHLAFGRCETITEPEVYTFKQNGDKLTCFTPVMRRENGKWVANFGSGVIPADIIAEHIEQWCRGDACSTKRDGLYYFTPCNDKENEFSITIISEEERDNVMAKN